MKSFIETNIGAKLKRTTKIGAILCKLEQIKVNDTKQKIENKNKFSYKRFLY